MKQLSSTELTIRQGERLAGRLTDTLYSGRQDIKRTGGNDLRSCENVYGPEADTEGL